MTKLLFRGKELSTRSRMKTLEEARSYFIGMGDLESLKIVEEIINEKNTKTSGTTKKNDKEEKNEEPKKEKKVLKFEKATEEDIEEFEPDAEMEDGVLKQNVIGLGKMSKDLKKTVVTLNYNEVKSLVDFYYQIQDFRIGTENQVRSLNQGYDNNDNPDNVSIMKWNLLQLRNIEDNTKAMLEAYSDTNPVTRWLKRNKGIGPVISSCLYAYFNVDGVNSAGNFWSYAGLNDNNNPWLGKEKATNIVKDLMAIRDIRNKGFAAACEELDIDIDKSLAENLLYDENAIKEYVISKMPNKELSKLILLARKIVDEDLRSYKQLNQREEIDDTEVEYESIEDEILHMDTYETYLGVINMEEPFSVDHFADYIINLSDKNIITHVIMSNLYTKLNGRRKINNMIKSATINKEEDKYDGFISKKSLISYLSKPPYNIKLKVLMWKIGESFVKVSNRGSMYGELYKERKEYETRKNENLEYKDQAAKALRAKNYSKNSIAYSYYIKGMLPPAQIAARAKRWTVKIFVEHVFEAMYIYENGELPPMVFPISRLGHVDYIKPEVPFETELTFKPDKRAEYPKYNG